MAWCRELSQGCGTVEGMENKADLLMLRGVLAGCADCGDERVFVPADVGDMTGEYCCTGCDAAVILVAVLPDRDAGRRTERVA